jgi:hypothetical protein
LAAAEAFFEERWSACLIQHLSCIRQHSISTACFGRASEHLNNMVWKGECQWCSFGSVVLGAGCA